MKTAIDDTLPRNLSALLRAQGPHHDPRRHAPDPDGKPIATAAAVEASLRNLLV